MAVYVWLCVYAGRAKASALCIPIYLRGSKDQGQNDLWKVNSFPGVVNSFPGVVILVVYGLMTAGVVLCIYGNSVIDLLLVLLVPNKSSISEKTHLRS